MATIDVTIDQNMVFFGGSVSASVGDTLNLNTSGTPGITMFGLGGGDEFDFPTVPNTESALPPGITYNRLSTYEGDSFKYAFFEGSGVLTTVGSFTIGVATQIAEVISPTLHYLTVNVSSATETAKVSTKVNGAWKKGDAYVKVNGSWKKGKAVYTKVNGAWKKGV